MTFGKKKSRKIELLKTEIDFYWKLFLVINGIFIVTLAKSFQLQNNPSFGESLILITCIIYGGAAIFISSGIVKKYYELFRILSKK